MKRYSIIALAAVLTMSLFAGCRRKNNPATLPTTMPPVVPTTQATTAPTTAPTTMPTTQATEDTTPATEPDGSMNTDAAGTEEPTGMDRSRRVMPGNTR